MRSDDDEDEAPESVTASWQDSRRPFIGPVRPLTRQVAQFGDQGSNSWSFDTLVDRPGLDDEMVSRESLFDDDNMSNRAADDNDSTRGSMDGSDTEMQAWSTPAKYGALDNSGGGGEDDGYDDTMDVRRMTPLRSPTPTDIHLSDASMD